MEMASLVPSVLSVSAGYWHPLQDLPLTNNPGQADADTNDTRFQASEMGGNNCPLFRDTVGT